MKVTKIIKIKPNERVLVKFEGEVTKEQIDLASKKIDEFFKNKEQKYLMYGGFKIVKTK